MLSILRDPIWQFVGAVLTVLTAAVVFWLQRQRKSLSYDVVAFLPLLSVEQALKSKIEISYEGRTVPDLHLAVLRVRNDGNRPIEAKDFAEGLGFRFPKGTDILSADIIEAPNALLQTDITFSGREIQLGPFTLNDGDGFSLRILAVCQGQKYPVTPMGYITGIREIRLGERQRRTRLFWIGAAIGYGLVVLAVLVPSQWFDTNPIFSWMIFVAVLGALFLMIVGAQDEWRFTRMRFNKWMKKRLE